MTANLPARAVFAQAFDPALNGPPRLLDASLRPVASQVEAFEARERRPDRRKSFRGLKSHATDYTSSPTLYSELVNGAFSPA